MSSNTSRHVVCRLLGGSGRPSLVAVPTRKLTALFAPSSRTPADTAVRSPLPLAARVESRGQAEWKLLPFHRRRKRSRASTAQGCACQCPQRSPIRRSSDIRRMLRLIDERS